MALTSIPPQQSSVQQLVPARRPIIRAWQRLCKFPTWFSMSGLDLTERNARYLEIEVLWASFLSAAATFNAAFAVRLGASNQEIGLLSSIPALLALLITIPAGRYFSRQAQWMPLILRSLFTYRLGFLVVALVPWLPLPAKDTLLIWTLIAFTLPAHFFAVGWNSMLADAIPELNRARVFAIRNGLAAIAVTAGIFAAGQWLEHAPFPINYQIMYAVGFVTSLASLYYISRLRLPAHDRKAPAEIAKPVSVREGWAKVLGPHGLFRSQPDFVRMVVNTFVHAIGLWMIAPLYVLYYVRELGAGDGWLGLHGTLANLTPVLGYYLWQRATVRWGENRVLKWTICLVGIYPVLIGASPNLTLILVWTALHGLLAPGVNLSHFPMLLKICPAHERPLYMSVYTTLMNAGAFVMPLVGVMLAGAFGIVPVLITGGILCLAGSASFIVAPLRTPDSLEVRKAQTPAEVGT